MRLAAAASAAGPAPPSSPTDAARAAWLGGALPVAGAGVAVEGTG